MMEIKTKRLNRCFTKKKEILCKYKPSKYLLGLATLLVYVEERDKVLGELKQNTTWWNTTGLQLLLETKNKNCSLEIVLIVSRIIMGMKCYVCK